MKMSQVRSWLASRVAPNPTASRKTHTAYSEQFVDDSTGHFTGRVYDYATGKVLEEFSGQGGRKAAGRAAVSRLKKYRKE